jgi:hypothetical protein
MFSKGIRPAVIFAMQHKKGKFVLRSRRIDKSETAEALVVLRTKVPGKSSTGAVALLPDFSLLGSIAVVLPDQRRKVCHADLSQMVTVEPCILRTTKHPAGFCTFRLWRVRSGWGGESIVPPSLREDWDGKDEGLVALASWGGFNWLNFAEHTRTYREMNVSDYHRMMEHDTAQFIEMVHARTATLKSGAPIPAATRGKLPPIPKLRVRPPVPVSSGILATALTPCSANG